MKSGVLDIEVFVDFFGQSEPVVETAFPELRQ